MSSASQKDYYAILSVDKGCSLSEITKAYRKLALKYHPDRVTRGTAQEKEHARDRFHHILEAYQCLSDPDKRKTYDTNNECADAFPPQSASAPRPHRQTSLGNTMDETMDFQVPQSTPSAGFSPFGNQGETEQVDFKASYFTHTNQALKGFMRWRNQQFSSKRSESRMPPPHSDQWRSQQHTPSQNVPAHSSSGWTSADGKTVSPGERLMREAARCFGNPAVTNRGNEESNQYFQRSSSRRIPIPSANASCSSGYAAMGRIPSHPKGSVAEGSYSRGYSSPSSAECDDDLEAEDDLTAEPPRIVVLRGLTSASARQYNQKLGWVIDTDVKDGGRWRVQIAGNSRVFRLRPENLLMVPCGVLCRLRTKKKLNGREVILLGPAGDGSGRYDCALMPNDPQRQKRGRRYCVHPKNVILGPGTRVDFKSRIADPVARLQSKDDIRIISHTKSGNRNWYVLKLPGRSGKRAKARSNEIAVAFHAYSQGLAIVSQILRLH